VLLGTTGLGNQGGDLVCMGVKTKLDWLAEVFSCVYRHLDGICWCYMEITVSNCR
jgi:hypothetical protein